MARVSKILDDFSGSEYYVDYNAGNDMLGDGSAINPWQTIKHAIESGITRNSTNGDRINLKSGYAHVVAATPDYSLYGTPSVAAPLFIQGYTSSANDGGYAEVTCSSGQALADGTTNDYRYLRFAYLSAISDTDPLHVYQYVTLIECKLESTGSSATPFSASGGGNYAYYCTFISAYNSSPWGKAFSVNGGVLVNCFFLLNGQGGAALKSTVFNCLAISNSGTANHSHIFAEGSMYVNSAVIINGPKATSTRYAFGGNATTVGCYVQGADTAYQINRTQVFTGNAVSNCTTPVDYTANPYANALDAPLYEDPAVASSDIATGTSLTDYALSGNGGISNLEFPVGWSNGTPGAKAYTDGTGLGFQESGSSSGSSSSSGSKWTTITDLTGLVAWYKPETLASTYSNGDSITTWADSSGNSRDLTGSGTTRPLAAANAFGTYMAADFDGTDDILSTASYQQAPNPCYSIVFEMDVLKQFNGPITIMNQNPPAWYTGVGNLSWVTTLIHNNGKIQVNRFKDTNNNYDNSLDGAVSATTKYIMTIAYTEIAWDMRLNGSEVSGGASTNTPSSSFPSLDTAYIHLGHGGHSSSPFNGKIVEAVVYDAVDIDNANSIWVEGYLADKYGITLADGHLFKNAAPQNSPTTYNATGSGSSYTNVAAAKFTRLE